MIRPCNIALCDCPGSDSPVLNISSESPDPLLFAGIGWDIYNPWVTPPLGGDQPYVSHDCFNISYSAISQALADLMAQNNAALCNPAPGPWTFPPFPPWPPLPPFPDFNWTPPVFVPPDLNYQQFTNERQEATASCPNGAIFTYAIEAGTLLSVPIPPVLGPIMVQLLNAQVMAFALQQVWAMRVCLNVPGQDFRDPNPPPDWPPNVSWPPTWAPGSNPITDPPTNWPPGTNWPTSSGPTSSGPTLAANPGWCCLGEDLDPALNTYSLGTGSADFTFSVFSGALAPGTTLDQISPRVAEVSGVPFAPGVYTYTIKAVQNGNPGISVQVTDTLNVFGMTTGSLPDGTVGDLYSEQLATAGGTAPVTFALVGLLPDGLTLSATGLISGTPTTDETASFTVKFTDAEGGTCQQSMTIDVVDVPVTPTVWSVFSQNGGCIVTLAGHGNSVDCSFQNSEYGQGEIYGNGTKLNGVACNCNLHIDCSAGGYRYVTIQVSDALSNLILNNSFIDGGTYDFPFTITELGAYVVDFQWTAFGGEESIFTATLSNIP